MHVIFQKKVSKFDTKQMVVAVC